MRPRALLALAAFPALTGCLATQRDVREIQAQVDQLRMAQEQMMRELREQNAQSLDSLSRQGVRTRGDLANRMLQMERQLVQIQELTGQSQQAVAQLRSQLRERQQEIARDTSASAGQGTGAPAADPAGAEDLYNDALAAYRRGSHATARDGFQEFLRTAPRHRLAPDAQLYVGETYAQTRAPQQAVEAFARVAELFPTSPQAATALYRAGQVELGRGRREEARARFNQVVRAYPRSPEATRARQEITRMGAREE
jgi:tol-pal system protein YbgF